MPGRKRAIVRHASANAAPKSNDDQQQALAYRMTIRSHHHTNPRTGIADPIGGTARLGPAKLHHTV
jgi:hypothetical protein